MLRATTLLLVSLTLAPGIVPAQTGQTSSTTAPAPIERDTPAVSLTSQSYQTMVGTTVLQDVALQASASWVAGSDQELGSVLLEAKGGQEARMALSLTSGQRQEVRNALNGPQGAWEGPDGVWYAFAQHNCWTNASWFVPAFTLQEALNDPTLSLIYIGADTFSGTAAIHLIFYRTVSGSGPATITLIQRLSTLHVYLDSNSGFPVGVRFNTHPDSDAGLSIPVEIRFSNYQQVNGVQIPFRIQKFLQGALQFDLTVSAAQINSGLNDSAFALPTTLTATGGVM